MLKYKIRRIERKYRNYYFALFPDFDGYLQLHRKMKKEIDQVTHEYKTLLMKRKTFFKKPFNVLFKYKYEFKTYRQYIPPNGDADFEENFYQYFVKRYYFLFIPVWQKELFSERVPNWAYFHQATLGSSTWKSSFPQWCFLYSNIQNEKFNNKKH